MRTQELIKSGILETYVLGLATDQEIALVQDASRTDPDVELEILAIEQQLLNIASQDTPDLPASVKSELEQKLFTQEKPQPKVIAFNTYKAIAASVAILLVGSVSFNVYQYKNLSSTKAELADLRLKNSSLAQNNESTLTKLKAAESTAQAAISPGQRIVALASITNDSTHNASVIWNPSSKEAFIVASNLPAPPSGKQYQLWALVGGKPVDAGVFNPTQGLELAKVKDVANAEMFAVTIEDMGGKPTPSLETLCFAGKVAP